MIKAFTLVLSDLEHPGSNDFYFGVNIPCLRKVEKIENIF